VRRPTIAAAMLLVAVFLACSAPAARNGTPNDWWTTFGNGSARIGAATASFNPRNLKPSFFLPVAGRITAQVLAAPAPGGGTTLFATTSDGRVYAVTQHGYVLWTRDFGQLAGACPQLDGYGITGTGAIEVATRTL
jgi:outer membrane protein assembly factor BamB